MSTLRRTLSYFVGLSLWLIASPVVAHADERAYVANAAANAISVVDIGTGSEVGTIGVGARPYAVAVSPDGTRAYVTNFDGPSVSVIDTAADAVVATVPVGHYPIAITVSPDGTRIYVACYGGALTVIDAATNSVVHEIHYLGFLQDVAVSADGSRLFWVENLTNHYGPMLGNIAVADASSGEVQTRIAVYDPSAITLSPDGKRAYVVNNRGGFSVVDLTSGTVVEEVAEGNTLSGLAVTPDGSRILVVDRVAGTLVVLDSASYAVIARVAVVSEPSRVAVTPDGTRAIVSNEASAGASVVDLASNAVTTTISVGGSFGEMAFVPARALATSKEQCRAGGWRAYPSYRNAGDCMRSVAGR